MEKQFEKEKDMSLTLIHLLIGIVIGFIPTVFAIKIGALSIGKKPIGDLRVVQTDTDGPYLFLELYADTNVLCHGETVIFKVLNQEYPHE